MVEEMHELRLMLLNPEIDQQQHRHDQERNWRV